MHLLLFPSLSLSIFKAGLNMQLRNLLDKTLPIRLQGSLDLRLDEFLNLLWRTANECTRLQQRVEFGDDRLKEWGAADALD